jgi:hypothetical protein
MNYLTKDRILIVVSFIIISLIMFTYSKNRFNYFDKDSNKITENFNEIELCDSYLKEALHTYPCSSPGTKRHFLDWCNSWRRRQGFFPRITDAMAMFYRFRDTDLTFYSLK